MLRKIDSAIELILCKYYSVIILGNKSGIYRLYREINNISDPYLHYQPWILVEYHGVRVMHEEILDEWTDKPILFVKPNQDFFDQSDCKLMIFEEEENND